MNFDRLVRKRVEPVNRNLINCVMSPKDQAQGSRLKVKDRGDAGFRPQTRSPQLVNRNGSLKAHQGILGIGGSG